MSTRSIFKGTLWTVTLMVGAALMLTACGTAGSGGSSGSSDVTLKFKVVGADDGTVGPDGNKHDTFQALNLQPVQVGQRVTISIENADESPHSFTSPELKINLVIPGAKDGKPSVTNYTFTPTVAGTYRWFCAIPCDSDNDGWAMSSGGKGPDQDNFMAGYITVNNNAS